MLKELIDNLTPVIEDVAKDLLIEIVEIKAKRHRQTTMLDIIADKSTGGISIGECTKLNKEILKKIEEKCLLDDPYTIEVSSPGLDRPLVSAKDFKRNIGREVEFILLEPVHDKKHWIGLIGEVKDGKVVVAIKQGELNISLTNIQSAVQVLPL